MKNRNACFYIAAGVLLLLTALSHAKPQKNILLFYVDDLRPELGCYGAEYIKSPNIDTLAEAGIVFDRAYCQQALCGPSRISMMSGQYPNTTGIMDLWTPLTKIYKDAMTLPRYFKERGYFTGSYGKVYHHTRDDTQSWTELIPKPDVKYANAETLRGMEERVAEGKKRGLSVDELRVLGKGPAVEMADVADNAYPDGKIADQAIESLRKNKEKPFFICVGITKPHLPFAAPKRYWDLYGREQFDVPKQVRPEGAPDVAFTVWGELRGYRGMPKEGLLTDEQTRELKHGYAASVSFADAQVGRVLDELDRLGLREDTIIVLWGDHGWKLGEYGAWCKHTNFELDANVPFIVSAPGFTKGKRSGAMVEMIDIFPTLADLTGGEVPESCDGKSMKALLKNPDGKFRPYAVTMYPRGSVTGYSMRNQRWRYTEWIHTETKEIKIRELYDHKDSPIADKNLANNPEYKGLIAELSKQLNSAARVEATPVRKK
ncbi:sulfatase [Pontiellaceae bacterium B12227]|nr:sulfatase [Pontiellaceae bacterium B12227]